MSARLPLLCECERREAYVEHRDMHSTYVLWRMHRDAAHVVFLDRAWIDGVVYADGRTFAQLMADKPPDECCRMVARLLLGALRYKPDYLVVVGDAAPLTSGLGMGPALRLAQPCADAESVRRLAEGPDGLGNALGRHLTAMFGGLADRGFFEDPKNRRYVPT
jgi:hypothetical protein